MSLAYDQSSVASDQRSPYWANSAPSSVLQAELDSLKAQKLENVTSVGRLDEKISALEAAVAVLGSGP